MEDNDVQTDMDIEKSQAQESPATQVISQHLVEIKTELHNSITSIINNLNSEHQRFQPTSDQIRKTIRQALKDYLTDGCHEVEPISRPSMHSKCTLGPSQPPDPVRFDNKAQFDQLNLSLATANSEIIRLKAQLEAAESRADQLRNIIVPSDMEAILDGQIQNALAEIRTTTQVVVTKFYTKSGKYCDSTRKETKRFFREFEVLSPKRQKDAIQSEISKFLVFWFFSRRVKDFGLGEQHQNLEGLFKKTQIALTEVSKTQEEHGMVT
ncbi:hypothetical protein F53441_12661 [Fusarium austroafricanum]|uniref:Uncharacterized protein n=1 Tax=Fusarium austroafricanum TaxID=2364996 RepID=A0A8H4NL19_9HYPO|nr:hypothetical protein F53441_12661 [Fusarium austroafricanum]